MKIQYNPPVWVSWLIIALCWSTVYMYNQSGFAQFKTYTGMRIKQEYVYLEDRSRGAERCASQCAVNKDCLSASFSNNGGLCRMSTHLINGSENQHRLEVQTSWSLLHKQECMAGWIELNGTCYFFFEELTRYFDGQNYCNEKGGKLAEPQTEDMFEILRNYLVTNYGDNDFWIGLYTPADDISAVWISNGEVPDYSGWADQPPGFQEELVALCFLVTVIHGCIPLVLGENTLSVKYNGNEFCAKIDLL